MLEDYNVNFCVIVIMGLAVSEADFVESSIKLLFFLAPPSWCLGLDFRG